MYGLPKDVDLAFFLGTKLLQVCVGENEVIANFDPAVSVMIASAVRLHPAGDVLRTLEDSRVIGSALIPLVGSAVHDASAMPDGTLHLAWENGTIVEILDSWAEFESYTIRNGDDLIVV